MLPEIASHRIPTTFRTALCSNVKKLLPWRRPHVTHAGRDRNVSGLDEDEIDIPGMKRADITGFGGLPPPWPRSDLADAQISWQCQHQQDGNRLDVGDEQYGVWLSSCFDAGEKAGKNREEVRKAAV